MAKFKAGDPVVVRNTGEVASVFSVSERGDRTIYYVFQDGKKYRYRESELDSYEDTELKIIEKIRNNEFADAESFRKYAYNRMFSENKETNLYSYQGNKIIFNPFQYKPLLKFLSVNSDERLLIADEVGVGKTIESGIIIDELLARGELKSNDPIMIVCPSVLCNKWQNELKEKFLMDDFMILDGKTLGFVLKHLKETSRFQNPHCIVSEQLIRGDKYQEMLEQCLEEIGDSFIKLLVVDECHHYRNPATGTHTVGEVLSLCSDKVIMLSATPFNLRSDDLYNQLHILNPSLFPDLKEFNQLRPHIRNVNRAISLLHYQSYDTKKELIELLYKLSDTVEEHSGLQAELNEIINTVHCSDKLTTQQIVKFEKSLTAFNPIATSFTRTQKKEALEHRVTRKMMNAVVHFTPEESDVYHSFIDTSRKRFEDLGISRRALSLILNGLERIAASSLSALEKNVRYFSNLSVDEFVEMMSDDVIISPSDAKKMLDELQKEYKSLTRKIERLNGFDSKYNSLKKMIDDIQSLNSDNRRIIVFSFYTETLRYLRKKLNGDGYKVALMYGKTPEETPDNLYDYDGFKVIGREDIMQKFQEGEFDILLISEVGGEGLDFQFCNSLINYDLPYNPMRIEQRIGRIDRMGQMADRVNVGSLCIAGTIDMSIYRVLLTRISDASDFMGDLEPIIAAKLTEMNQLLITNEFSQEELQKREQEIEQQIEKAKQVREEFDEAKFELVNDKGFRKEFENDIQNSRITPHESMLFTNAFLKTESNCFCKVLSETSCRIHLSKAVLDKLKSYYSNAGLGKAGTELKEIIRHQGIVILEFNGDEAYHNSETIFCKPVGAWIHFMMKYMHMNAKEDNNVFYGKIKDNWILPKGRYRLWIYEMNFKGFFNTKTYEYIIGNEDGTYLKALSEEQSKELIQSLQTESIPDGLENTDFEEYLFDVEDCVEDRKNQISEEAMNSNTIKITSRIRAIRDVSAERIRKLEEDVQMKSETKAKAIEREKQNTEKKVKVLEEKLKYVGTYSLDAICVIDCDM